MASNCASAEEVESDLNNGELWVDTGNYPVSWRRLLCCFSLIGLLLGELKVVHFIT